MGWTQAGVLRGAERSGLGRIGPSSGGFKVMHAGSVRVTPGADWRGGWGGSGGEEEETKLKLQTSISLNATAVK